MINSISLNSFFQSEQMNINSKLTNPFPKNASSFQDAFSDLNDIRSKKQQTTKKNTDTNNTLENYASITKTHTSGTLPSTFTSSVRSGIGDIIEEMAEKYGVPSSLITKVIETESNFNPSAISGAGAMGLMQLMPKTAEGLGVKDPFNPRENIEGGVKYLSQMLKRYGNTSLALAAYNAGPGNVDKYNGIPPFRETENYVKKILNT